MCEELTVSHRAGSSPEFTLKRDLKWLSSCPTVHIMYPFFTPCKIRSFMELPFPYKPYRAIVMYLSPHWEFSQNSSLKTSKHRSPSVTNFATVNGTQLCYPFSLLPLLLSLQPPPLSFSQVWPVELPSHET